MRILTRVMFCVALFLAAAGGAASWDFKELPTGPGESESCRLFTGVELNASVVYRHESGCTDSFAMTLNGHLVQSPKAASWRIENWTNGRFSLAEGRPDDLGVTISPHFGRNCLSTTVQEHKCMESIRLYPVDQKYGGLVSKALWFASLIFAVSALWLTYRRSD